MSILDAVLRQTRRRRETLALMADTCSRVRLLVIWGNRLRGMHAVRPSTRTIPLRIRPFGGRAVHVRPGSNDLFLLWATLRLRWSAPPRELAGTSLRRIAGLGLAGGLDLAALAYAHRDAELLGVEADAENVAVARLNVAPFADRCRIVHAAVWDREASLQIVRAGRAIDTYEVSENGAASSSGPVPGWTVAELLAERWPDGEPVDYVHVDVEGAHARLFHPGADWARVRAVKVAGHHGTAYSEAECARDLERLGFRARVIPGKPVGWTVGVREAG